MASRHASLSCERLLSMHDLTLASSGMNSLQSRMASGVQASRAASLPWAPAPLRLASSIPTGNANEQMKRIVDIFCFLNSDLRFEPRAVRVLGAIDGLSNRLRIFLLKRRQTRSIRRGIGRRGMGISHKAADSINRRRIQISVMWMTGGIAVAARTALRGAGDTPGCIVKRHWRARCGFLGSVKEVAHGFRARRQG